MVCFKMIDVLYRRVDCRLTMFNGGGGLRARTSEQLHTAVAFAWSDAP